MWIFILVIVSVPEITTKFYSTNVTDFSKCKVHYSRSEGTYKTFYEIADESRENDTVLDFHFSVLAPSDAHILLSPSSNLNRSDPAYEIVLGAGGNMFSDIRRAQKAAVKASIRRKGLLSALDIHSFWLHVSKDGLIEVGRDGDELAFISWQDPDPLPLKYFSFGTWPGVEAKWFFDCPREDNTTTNSKEVEQVLTDFQRLRRDLLTFYDPYVRPVLNSSDLTVVKMEMNLNYISLDEYKSSMHIRGTMKLTWTDEKMKWDRSKYGNIKDLHIVGRQIWRPDLVLYNAVDSMGRDILSETMMLVTNDGTVQWNPQAHIQVWCDISLLGHWPSDEHACNVFLGFWAEISNLQLEFNDANSEILGKQFQTEWDVLQVTAISNFGWNSTATNSTEESVRGLDLPFLTLIFKLRRNSSVYSAVFFTPFLIVAISILCTFWVSPYGYLKISLNCFQLIMISLVLVNLATFLPVHPDKTSYLVQLYEFSFFGSLTCLLLSVIVINFSRSQYKRPVPHCIWKILTSCLIQKLLLLPTIKISEDYGKLDEITVTKQHDESIQNTWILFGKAIDRIGCIIFFILIVYAICSKY